MCPYGSRRPRSCAGLRDLTVVADKARLAQRGLYDVDSLLLTISRALADSHCADAQSSGEAPARLPGLWTE